ncbi:MAG: serine/threonine-protein kinase [Planctomycetota bacterium]
MHEDWIATKFLLQLRADEQGRGRRSLAEYLAGFPGHEELVAREFVAATADAAPDDDGGPEGTIGPFRLLRRLGRGSQGVVHLAEDSRWPRLVALKIVADDDPGARLAMLREAVASARIRHRGFAALLEAGEHEGRPWIATQDVAGESLRERLADGRALAVDEAVAIVAELAAALHAAHEHGLVHRDVKPSNIVLAADGPVLLDLGLAHDERGALPTLTGTAACGTPDYMAPEQLEAAQAIDRRVDVWALGVVLYRCLFGRLPFAAPSRAAVCHAILEREPELPHPLDRRLRAILTTALQRDRDRRYASAAAFGADLAAFRAGEPVAALLPGPLERCGRLARRHRAATAVAAAIALAFVVGLLVELVSLGREAQLRLRAERAFADVRTMARTLAFDVHDRLRGVAGATAARRLVLERARDLFERLLPESEDDPALALELVGALVRLGDVLGHEGTENLGAVADAEACYARALGLATRCWQRGVAEPAAARQLLVAFLRDADAHTHADPGAAAVAYAGVLERIAAARQRWPADRELAVVDAASRLNNGLLLQGQGRDGEAVAFFAAAAATLRQLAATGTPAETGEQLAATLVAHGRALAHLGRLEPCAAILEEARELAAAPASAVRPATLACACLELGTVRLAAGQRDEGEALLAETIAIRRRCLADNPDDVTAALLLASACFERALRVEAAAADIDAGLEVCAALRRRLPAHPRAVAQQARLVLLRAQRCPDAGAARADLDAAQALLGELRGLSPRDLDAAGIEQWLHELRGRPAPGQR